MHPENEEKEKTLREIKEFQKVLEKDIEYILEKDIEYMQQHTERMQKMNKAMKKMRIIFLSYATLVIVNVVLALVTSTNEEWIVFSDLFMVAINAITVIFMTILHEHNKHTLSPYPFSLKFLLFVSVFVNIISAASNIMSIIV